MYEKNDRSHVSIALEMCTLKITARYQFRALCKWKAAPQQLMPRQPQHCWFHHRKRIPSRHPEAKLKIMLKFISQFHISVLHSLHWHPTMHTFVAITLSTAYIDPLLRPISKTYYGHQMVTQKQTCTIHVNSRTHGKTSSMQAMHFTRRNWHTKLLNKIKASGLQSNT